MFYETVDRQKRQGPVCLAFSRTRFEPWRLNISKGHVPAVVHVDGVSAGDGAETFHSVVHETGKDPHVKAIALRAALP